MESGRHIIYLAGGCFWGTQHYMSQFEGVLETVAGYANGSLPDPTYKQVYTDETGHVECVRVTYDRSMISLETICRLFFKSIDPLLKNRQGDDVGTRYRTGVYWDKEEDAEVIDSVFEDVQCAYDAPLAVEKGRLECFYPAEDYHQDYLIKNPEGYCHLSPALIKTARIYSQIISDLRMLSDDEKKVILPRFFKTGKGEYGEGDRFIGVIVPDVRRVAKLNKDVSYEVQEWLLESEWHECRLCSLLILIEKYRTAPEDAVKFYLSHLKGINNWDLVDLSAPYILGAYLAGQEDRSILAILAGSSVMWEQRIAIVSTLMLIRNGQYNDTMRLAEGLLQVRHDLMQKAVGWMLREVGKRNEELLVEFLEKYKTIMPRTMLRYAIERFEPQKRMYFMGKQYNSQELWNGK